MSFICAFSSLFRSPSSILEKKSVSSYVDLTGTKSEEGRPTEAAGALHFTLLSLSILPKKTTLYCMRSEPFENEREDLLNQEDNEDDQLTF